MIGERFMEKTRKVYIICRAQNILRQSEMGQSTYGSEKEGNLLRRETVNKRAALEPINKSKVRDCDN